MDPPIAFLPAAHSSPTMFAARRIAQLGKPRDDAVQKLLVVNRSPGKPEKESEKRLADDIVASLAFAVWPQPSAYRWCIANVVTMVITVFF